MSDTTVKHDFIEYVPHVGMTGLFQLKEPYTKLITNDIEYTCIAVNNISGMLASGLDPRNDIYLANGDTEESYNSDARDNRCIVTLQSGKGNIVVVPNSALTIVPNANGVKYSSIMLGIHLTALPDTVDLSLVKSQVSDIIYKQLGVQCNIFQTTMGGSLIVSFDKHEQIEKARIGIVSEHSSPLIENIELKAQVTDMKNKITMLESYIESQLSK